MAQRHFIYRYDGKPQCLTKVTCTPLPNCKNFLNFPLKSFYSAKDNTVYTFYRQGHCLTVDLVQVCYINDERIINQTDDDKVNGQ